MVSILLCVKIQIGWLEADISGIGGNWRENPNLAPIIANGYGQSIVWSTGGSCVGHGSTAIGSGIRKVKVIDVDTRELGVGENASDERKKKVKDLKCLAYALLYSVSRNEYSPGGPLTPPMHHGKWAINNWFQRHFGSYGIHTAQFNYLTGYDEIKYDENYGGLTIEKNGDSVNYAGVKKFLDKSKRFLKINENETQKDREDGHPLKKWENIEKNGSTCTVIGPYHVNIVGGLEEARLRYINTHNQEKVMQAIGYCKTVNGELKNFEDLENFSARQRFFLVFEGNISSKVKQIDKIVLHQKTAGYIKGRMAYSEAGNGGQTIAVFHATGGLYVNKLELEIPPTDITIKLKKVDANTSKELTNARFVLKNLDTGKYATFGRSTDSGVCSWTNNIQGATSYKTGDVIKTNNPGNYQFYEVKAHSQLYETCKKTESGKKEVGQSFKVELGETHQEKITNQANGGLITIKKIDAKTGSELSNVRIIIKKDGQYAKGGTGADPATWTSDIYEADRYQTGQTIKFDQEGIYEFYEVQRQNSTYAYCSIDEPLPLGNSVELCFGYDETVTFVNVAETAEFTIYKADEDTGQPLLNTRFIVGYQDGSFVQDGGNGNAKYVTNQWLASEYRAGDTVRSLTKDGKYTIYEVQRESESYQWVDRDHLLKVGEVEVVREWAYQHGSGDGYYDGWQHGYGDGFWDGWETDIDGNPITDSEGNKISKSCYHSNSCGHIVYYPKSLLVEIPVTNKRKYVKIAGYVWEDKTSPGKNQEYDGLYNTSVAPDQRVAGVWVTLRDRKGDILREYYHNKEAGQTSKQTDSNGYYEFREVPIEHLRGGAYIEFVYNGMGYKSIEIKPDIDNGNKATDEAERPGFNSRFATITHNLANGTTPLQYDKVEHMSILNYEGNSESAGYPVAGVDSKYEITANTYQATPNAFLGQTKYSVDDIYKQGLDVVDNINLGLRQREQPDLAIAKDIHNVKVVVNGKTHVYEYAQRFKNQELEKGIADFGVRYGVPYKDMKYTRPIYRSDYEEDYLGDDKAIQIHITYKIKLYMEESNLTARVNQLVDYYDARYEVERVGTRLENYDPQGEIAKTQESCPYGGYKRLVLDTNMMIDSKMSKEEGCVYVQFNLNKEAIGKCITEPENEDPTRLLNNVVEISSYSIFENGETYAGIDKNSNPGSAIPGDENTYENDTDASPTLKIVPQGTRTMKGKVFEDKIESPDGIQDPNEIMANQQRLGNGKYDLGENGISGVTVELKELETGQVWTKQTDENGNFTIEDYIPGEYELRYIWGDSIYTVQDYKGTIYIDEQRHNDVENNPRWWHEEKMNPDGTQKEEGTYEVNRLTDAIDDYDTRIQIDNQIGTVNQAQTNTNKIDKMVSKVPGTMEIGVEYNEDPYSASYGLMYQYNVEHMDFGIAQRARQKLEISKNVTRIKIILANGQTIVDAQVNPKDGSLSGLTQYVTSKKYTDGKIGFIKAEIDKELIQGATIKLEYTIKVENKGEIDYATPRYYTFGVPGTRDDIVKMKPDVYDYLDSGINVDEENNNANWEEISQQTYQTQTTYTTKSETITERYYQDKDRWESKKDIYTEIFKTFETRMLTIIQKTVRNAKLYGKTILNSEKWNRALFPGEDNTQILYTTKLLSNTAEIEINNDAEITEVERVSNEKVGNIPEVMTSQFYDRGQSSTITPPTGQNRNYIIAIIMIVVTLTGFIIGIIIIKKKVL